MKLRLKKLFLTKTKNQEIILIFTFLKTNLKKQKPPDSVGGF